MLQGDEEISWLQDEELPAWPEEFPWGGSAEGSSLATPTPPPP